MTQASRHYLSPYRRDNITKWWHNIGTGSLTFPTSTRKSLAKIQHVVLKYQFSIFADSLHQLYSSSRGTLHFSLVSFREKSSIS